ncbi:hypothetical protein ACET6Z_03160 [Aeromonas veronii]
MSTPKTSLFLALPESTITSKWSTSNEDLLTDEIHINRLFHHLSLSIESINNENYLGYYDIDNINNFLVNLDGLDDFYPTPPRTYLQLFLSTSNFTACENFKTLQKTAKIYNQNIPSASPLHNCSFKLSSLTAPNNFVFLNFNAFNLTNSELTISIYHNSHEEPEYEVKMPHIPYEYNIDDYTISTNNGDILSWFWGNRIPARLFHDTDKHRAGNNGNWQNANPLHTSLEDAQRLLNSAIEVNGCLYNFDDKHDAWIRFMYDNVIINNQMHFHGFNVAKDAQEIPNDVRKIFNK